MKIASPKPSATLKFETSQTRVADASSPRSQRWATGGRFAARVLLVGVFWIAAITKMFSFTEFQSTLFASRLVPEAIVPLVAVVIVAMELATVGLFLRARALRQIVLQGVALLCCSFISYSVWKWSQNIEAPCNCFGVLFKLELYQSILLNIFLLALTFLLLEPYQGQTPTSETVREGDAVTSYS